MTHPERDDEFEAFLKRRTVLPGGLPVDDKLEPPATLDSAVLQQAREAIQAQKRSERVPRWAPSLAIAATILLCLSIVLNIGLNTNRPNVSQQRMTAANADRAVADSGAEAAKAMPRDGAAATADNAPASVAASGPALARAAAGPQGRTDNAAGSGASSEEQRREQAGGAQPSLAGSGSPSQAAPSEAKVASASGVRPLLPAETQALRAPIVRQEAPELAAAMPPPPAGATDRLADTAAAPAAKSAQLEEAMSRDRALAKRKSDAGAAAPASALSHPQDPKIWLQQIDALRAQGKTAEADAEMQRFRAAFPAYPAKPAAPAPSQDPK